MRLYDYGPSGNCYKVRLLLALLGRECERVPVDIFAGDTLTPEYEALNPTRRTPVLELDDGEAIAQSNAILLHLAAGSDYLPGDPLGLARAVEWLLFEQEWIAPGIALPRFLALTGRAPAEAAQRRAARGAEALRILDRHLATRDFVLGERASIADVSLYAYVHVAGDAGLDLGAWPSVGRWLGRVEALPGYVDDLAPYPPNARPGAGRWVYDPA